MATLLLLGGGHAHMTTLANLHRFVEEGHQVTVVQPSDHHYYSGMGPGMLGGTYEPEEIRFDTRRIVEKQGGTFIRDKAVAIDPIHRRVTLGNGRTIEYDRLSCNVGSHVPLAPLAGKEEALVPAKPIEKLADARKNIVERLKSADISMAVIGGGPSAIEIAGNLRQLGDKHGGHRLEISLFCGRTLLPGSSPWLQKRTAVMLETRNVRIHRDSHVTGVKDGEITLEDHSRQPFDMIFAATGIEPSPLFRDSGFDTGADGALKVNRFLQSVDSAEIFGGGDCIDFSPAPLDKVGVYAVRQNEVLLNNLLASLANKKLQPFNPGGGYLLIYNLGGGSGIFKKGPLKFSGSIAFKIKDYIDRSFIRRFKIPEIQGR